MKIKTKIAIIGSTGSIGLSALEVVRQHQDRYEIVALAAGSNRVGLESQVAEFKPQYVALHDEKQAGQLQRNQVEVRAGSEGVSSLATLDEVDVVILAVVGIAGLAPALAAIRAGKRLALANKEVLVSAGALIYEELKHSKAEIIPVDSEHSAIFQCLQAAGTRGLESVERLVLTASGGPFREKSIEYLQKVTPKDALAHPTWNMGAKITIDSATLMNKGLEVIEACWMFGFEAKKVDVVIHPQSIIHSLVEYCDGATIAQLSHPNMCLAIQYALSYPERLESNLARLDLAQVGQLTFHQPDLVKFPCLALAYESINQGGTAATVLNAANEVAVAKFLNNEIGFTDIPKYIEKALGKTKIISQPTLEDIIATDLSVREIL